MMTQLSMMDRSNPTIAIITGELSGDRYGAALVTAIRAQQAVTIVAIGGPELRDTADHFLGDCTGSASVGIRSLSSMQTVSKVLDAFDEWVIHHPVSMAIIVDFPHYNFQIARRLQKKSIPIVTCITPNFWIWNDIKSAKRIAAYSSKIIAIFPPEYEMYRQVGANVRYFGNPIVDLIPPVAHRGLSRHLDDGTSNPIIVGLFPGSRPAELKLLLAKILKTAKELQRRSPRFQFKLPIAKPEFRPAVEALITKIGVTVDIVTPFSRDELNTLDVAICATGTMTLELIMNRVPMVVLGALPTVSYWVATTILRLKVPFCGLPNLIAGRLMVPELMQSQIEAIAVADAVCNAISPQNQDWQQARYTELHTLLVDEGGQSVFQRMAKWIVSPR